MAFLGLGALEENSVSAELQVGSFFLKSMLLILRVLRKKTAVRRMAVKTIMSENLMKSFAGLYSIWERGLVTVHGFLYGRIILSYRWRPNQTPRK